MLCGLTFGLRIVCRNSSTSPIAQAFARYYRNNSPLAGWCTPEGTEAFSRISSEVHVSNWRSPRFISDNLKLSSLGLGTQSGAPDNQTDVKMGEVLIKAIVSGKVNTIDTDINFRYGKSEKTINAVLNYLQHETQIRRDSIFVATKCGFIPNDIDSNLNQQAFTKVLLEDNVISKEDIVNGIHCLHPNFLSYSLEKSLLCLGLETIDLLYLNNPAEAQQPIVGRQQYLRRIEKAFGFMEESRNLKKIRYYGLSSFVSFRSPPEEQGVHCNLLDIVEVAEKVGGSNHGFRFVLVPFNLGMPEILFSWQRNKSNQLQNLRRVAEQAQVNLNLCCPLFQGRVASLGFESALLQPIQNNPGKHLQVARSVPGTLTTYFGSLDVQHVMQNLEVTTQPSLSFEEFKKVLKL